MRHCSIATTTSENEITTTLCPLPKAKSKGKSRRKRVSAEIITDIPVKKRMFLSKIIGNNCPSEKEDVVLSLADPSSDGGESLGDSLGETDEQTVLPKYGDFVIGKVHSVHGSFELFVGKLLDDLDTDDYYSKSYLEQSRKIKNGFTFPNVEYIAPIDKGDIQKVLPPPHQLPKPNGCVAYKNLLQTYLWCREDCY